MGHAVGEEIRTQTYTYKQVENCDIKADEFTRAFNATNADWVYFRFLPSDDQMAAMHRTGKRAFIAGATVSGNLPANWRQAGMAGMDGILTDHPLELAATLRQMGTK